MFMRNTFLLIGYRSFFKADRNKPYASNEKQIDNHTLMLDMLHSNMSVMCTYHCRGVFKNIFWCCSLLIFVAKKPAKGTELQFLCTQGTLQGGRVEDHRMMCTRHLHLITTIIYSSNTLHIYNLLHDVFNPLHPNISENILHTVLFTFPTMLARRICLTVKVLQLIIISFILMTLMLDSGMIFKREIRC